MSATPARLSIGQALAQLREEFPDSDIKESKIRFLASEGLVEPERTASGYRKYSDDDMERLRYILRAQKEQYLPLRVIGEHLDAMDRGDWLPGMVGRTPDVTDSDGMPSADSFRAVAANPNVRVSRRELIKTAAITPETLAELESYGLIKARPGTEYFEAEAILVAQIAGELGKFGIEPRHLRSFKAAADREVGFVEQVVAPIKRSREEGADGRAAQAVADIAALSIRLHATLVRAALRGLR